MEIPSEGRAIPSTGEREHAGPTPEEIARLAHSLWERRKGKGGTAAEDWLQAERELRRRKEMGAGGS